MVSPYDIATPGGVNAHVAHLARELEANGHEVRIYAPGSRRTVTLPGTKVMGRPISFPSGGSTARVTISPRTGRRVRAELETGFDVVHVHEPLVPVLPIQFLRFSTCVNVGTFHAARENGSRLYSFNHRLLRRWSQKLDGRIAVSPSAARLVSRYFPGQYEVIPNGVDVPRFATPLPPPAALQGIGRYILFVGRFEERKGLPVLLEAFAGLKARRPDLHLVVVGKGDRQALYEEWIAYNRLSDVHFAGYVSDDELPAYYQHAAAFCAPNTGNESFGMILLEAMAAGRPVVASNIEGFAAVVTHGVEGLLVPPRDPGALATALDQLLDDPQLGRALGARGALRAREFSWPSVAKRVTAYYERLLSERAPTAYLEA
jgi:phosphatidylinositol alpha-mannosyltransferase